MDDSPLINTTLAVLAGGEGARMGRPKADLVLNGRPILQYLLERWRWPGPTALVTAPGRSRPPGWELFDLEASDPVAGEGPLRGIHTALVAAATPLLMITTCDMPGVTPDALRWLAEQLGRSPHSAGATCRRQDHSGWVVEPFPSAVRRDAALELVERRLARGPRSPRSLTDDPAWLTLDAPPAWPPKTWANLNRPEDVRQFLSPPPP